MHLIVSLPHTNTSSISFCWMSQWLRICSVRNMVLQPGHWWLDWLLVTPRFLVSTALLLGYPLLTPNSWSHPTLALLYVVPVLVMASHCFIIVCMPFFRTRTPCSKDCVLFISHPLMQSPLHSTTNLLPWSIPQGRSDVVTTVMIRVVHS